MGNQPHKEDVHILSVGIDTNLHWFNNYLLEGWHGRWNGLDLREYPISKRIRIYTFHKNMTVDTSKIGVIHLIISSDYTPSQLDECRTQLLRLYCNRPRLSTLPLCVVQVHPTYVEAPMVGWDDVRERLQLPLILNRQVALNRAFEEDAAKPRVIMIRWVMDGEEDCAQSAVHILKWSTEAVSSNN